MNPFVEIERAVETALATYSNVHRGSGHHARVSTHLYEQAKAIVLACLGLDAKRHVVVFASPRRAAKLTLGLPSGSHHIVSSETLGLPLGLRALAVERRALPAGPPVETGGGTARLVSPGRVQWAHGADRFEAGTPAVTNAIALARALQLVSHHGPEVFRAALPAAAAQPDAQIDDWPGLAGKELLGKLRASLLGKGSMVPTSEGDQPYVNLDNAASTPTFEPIWNAVRRAWRLSKDAQRALIERSRLTCARAVGASLDSYELLFTANTTEAINLVADSLAGQSSPGVEPVVVGTYLEHNSNDLPWWRVGKSPLLRLPVDSDGNIDLAALEALLREHNQTPARGAGRIVLVAVSGASNVLGVYPPLAEICRVAHRYGARVLVDGAQLVAHREVAVEDCGIDYLVFSGHKVYAPFGTGVLLARKGLLGFSPSEMAASVSSGEENVGGIAALAKALELLLRIGFDVIRAEEETLTRQTLQGLAALPSVQVLGTKDIGSPLFANKGGIVAFTVNRFIPSRVARELAERRGVGVRYGCHCAHLLVKRMLRVPGWAQRLQHIMLTVASGMSLPGVLRVSFGLQNTALDVDAFLGTLAQITKRSRYPRAHAQMTAFERKAGEAVFPALV
jgi:selenocysteine lyase/cysteine desulfurase